MLTDFRPASIILVVHVMDTFIHLKILSIFMCDLLFWDLEIEKCIKQTRPLLFWIYILLKVQTKLTNIKYHVLHGDESMEKNVWQEMRAWIS